MLHINKCRRGPAGGVLFMFILYTQLSRSEVRRSAKCPPSFSVFVLIHIDTSACQLVPRVQRYRHQSDGGVSLSVQPHGAVCHLPYMCRLCDSAIVCY